MKIIKKSVVGILLSVVLLLNSSIVGFCADIDTSTYLTNEEDIYVIIREAMVDRADVVTVKFASPGQLDSEYFDRWLEGAFRETGKSNEGDYLRWHRGQIGASGGAWIYPDGTYYYSFDINLAYYTTKEQEDAVTAKINQVLDELNVSSMRSDYEKIKAIYDYICDHVVYDYANLEDDTYKLKHSAYAALINGTSVCQGYATLLYRMLREVGIDTRVVDGIGNSGAHAWNIVKLDGKYYLLDATWDAIRTEYEFFLKGSDDFERHTLDSKYLTGEFASRYPISRENYVYVEPVTIPGDVNDDGAIDTKDVTMIRRFIVGGYGVSIDTEVADVNNDGVVDTKDVTLIRRYIVGGYGVELI